MKGTMRKARDREKALDFRGAGLGSFRQLEDGVLSFTMTEIAK